ncbi:MAG: dihydropteroate synthase [Holosporaceae bacterium]|nr:dihydropteroate synthase [Holosporaceae bacterium]
MKTKETVLLAIGTNLGDRLQNLRDVLKKLRSCCHIKRTSHVIETEAILPENAPDGWNIPYLNMVIEADTTRTPLELLSMIKTIETKLGRNTSASRWSPRIIDIDILLYGDLKMETDLLTIPHNELKNRDFLQFLMEGIGYNVPEDIKLGTNNYTALNHFVLYPKFVGILNVTPDSFSDGGKYFDPEKAEAHARKLCADGASVIDVGAQSTRPGYVEVSPSEEILRLSMMLERCNDIKCISIDTYFDAVVKHVLTKPNVKWINDQNSTFSPDTIKLIADRDIKLVVMMHGMQPLWFEDRIKYLRNLGIKKHNIIVDPGIGFEKSRYENIFIIKNLKTYIQQGYEILLGASRKSFISLHANVGVQDRDIESISAACLVEDAGVDYLRVHNVKDHMRFFVTRHCIRNA